MIYRVVKIKRAYNMKSHSSRQNPQSVYRQEKRYEISCGFKKGKKICGSHTMYADRENGRVVYRCERGHIVEL